MEGQPEKRHNVRTQQQALIIMIDSMCRQYVYPDTLTLNPSGYIYLYKNAINWIKGQQKRDVRYYVRVLAQTSAISTLPVWSV